MEEGMIVFYVEDGNVYAGKVIDMEKTENGYRFSVDSYGSCEGCYRIDSSQIGRTVFFSEEDAETAAGKRKN